MIRESSDHGGATRSGRVALRRGCLLALVVPLAIAFCAVAFLLYTVHGFQRDGARAEEVARHRTAATAQVFLNQVLDDTGPGPPSREVLRRTGERYGAVFLSAREKEGSLVAVLRFFAEFPARSIFGGSHSRTYRCFSFTFGAASDAVRRVTTTPTEKCESS
ncbi:hypothetical protein OG230_14170 [Streptomyces sp. NBC_00234]|uniref:hypothetical protein n=1 Tax=Streptomyces sp. NBC_00234 TaxID=2903638 RepID=UPI002E2DCA59|nr:hypothetical protein [Streptomyces sp. NBC_00234]